MRILPLILDLSAVMVLDLPARQTDSPHGVEFKVSCSQCQRPHSWIANHEGPTNIK